MQRSDILPFLVSLGITGLLIWGLVYFVREWWGRLPTAVALILFILLAVMVIGYPIYALARWSDRYLTRVREAQQKSTSSEPRK
ncbi:MAG: hypothetical protein U1F42_03885 [Candidatus Competibacteraceae bacterium]